VGGRRAVRGHRREADRVRPAGPLRADNKSYAALVPEHSSAATRVANPGELQTPDADTRTGGARRRLHDPGGSEMRKVTAEDIAHQTQEDDGSDG
jgi:hypothetical protein